MPKKDKAAQQTKAGGRLGTKLKYIPDDAVPFGDGINLYSPSEKSLYNADACRDALIVEGEGP